MEDEELTRTELKLKDLIDKKEDIEYKVRELYLVYEQVIDDITMCEEILMYKTLRKDRLKKSAQAIPQTSVVGVSNEKR